MTTNRERVIISTPLLRGKKARDWLLIQLVCYHKCHKSVSVKHHACHSVVAQRQSALPTTNQWQPCGHSGTGTTIGVASSPQKYPYIIYLVLSF